MPDELLQKILTAPISSNETERLAALHRYKILDTPPEAAFDRITNLAARLFKMPIALISLVDESRAWFKSCVGFSAREVSRNDSLCRFAVLMDEPLIVPDTRKDERFTCNPFVQSEPGVRFYAGAPLLSHDGFNLGTLCLLDSQPHNALSAEQQATLVDLAAMVVDELELRLAAQKIAQIDAALLEVTQGVARVTGKAFVEALVQHFAKVLDVDYVYIGVIAGDDSERLKTIATCAQGQIVENLDYLLQDTPCWEVLEQRKICSYPRNVQAHFPHAPLLKPLSVESYVAAPFFDLNGTPLGLVGVMDGEPLENVHLAESLLTIFADRVATELERQQAEVALRESEEKYRTLFESIDEGFCVVEMLFDQNHTPIDYRVLEINPTFEHQTGLYQAVGKTARQLNLEEHWIEIYGQVALTGESVRFENGSETLGRWFDVYACCTGEPEARKVAIVFKDISDRKQTEEILRRAAELDAFRVSLTDALRLLADPVEIQAAASRVLGEYLGANRVAYFEVRGADYVVERDYVNGAAALAGSYPMDLFGSKLLTTYRRGRAVCVSEVATDPNLSPDQRSTYAAIQIGAYIGIPLVRGGEFVAGLAVHTSGSRDWTPEEVSLAEEVAERTWAAVERARAEAALGESENRLRLALESTELGTWDFNPITGTLQWDEQCKAMFGLSPEAEINYEGFLAGLHPEDRDRTDQVVRFALNPESNGEYEIEYRTVGIEDGVERWIAAKGKAFFNPAGIASRFIGTVLNRTEQKWAEAEREQLLQQEQAAREEAERANRLKDEFLAVLSHELRSPLNPILGWSKLLQNGKLDGSRQAEALKTIERNAKLQSQLIEDLLDISRIMQGKLSLIPAPVSLTFVISAAIETVRLAAESKQIQTTLDLDSTLPPISGDTARLQQVIWNLLTNAVKFTPHGGQVTIELRQIDQMAQIRVIDTGKGIAPQFLPHVFEYFRQEDGSTTRRFGGLGLGLAIVRQIVEMHGGTVQAESQGENQGATFRVQLPILPQATLSPLETVPPSAPAELPLKEIQVLVVDDDPDTREFQAFLLEQSGARVIAVASGAAALQVFDRWIPDVLVSDVGMAEMDGHTLIQQIRSRPPAQGGTIPAIALTAYAAEVDQQKAMRAGFQVHLTKPVEPDRLVESILDLLGG